MTKKEILTEFLQYLKARHLDWDSEDHLEIIVDDFIEMNTKSKKISKY